MSNAKRSYRRPTCLYFIHAPQSRRLKIGISVCPMTRLASLKTGAGEPLELLGWADYGGGPAAELRSMEAELHQCFAQWRLEGEWFEALPDILQFAYETRDPNTTPEARSLRVYDGTYEDPRRPKIPPGTEAPAGNSRRARLERYRIARGLAA